MMLIAAAGTLSLQSRTLAQPMLMTALSAGVGLSPAAVSHGVGSQVQRPLATVVVGGMLFGPMLILIVAPALRFVFLQRYIRASDAMSQER